MSIARGVVDVRRHEDPAVASPGILVYSVAPSSPLLLVGEGADVWAELVRDGPIDDASLSDPHYAMLVEMEEAGLVSRVVDHPLRVDRLDPPWLTSATHELVHAVVASVAASLSIRVIFIKGPALHRQGLRDREHSVDVDVWVDPRRLSELVDGLRPWGWNVVTDVWGGLPAYHSLTLRPAVWGCEIDVHRHFPGFAASEECSFDAVWAETERLSFANVDARVPRRDVHAVIEALHLARPQPGSAPSRARLAAAVDVLRSAGLPSADAAERLLATAALRGVLNVAFPARTFDETPMPLNWRWRQQPTRVRGYAVALRMLSPRDRVRLVARILWPPSSFVESSDRTSGGTGNRAGARLRRVWRGAVASVRRSV